MHAVIFTGGVLRPAPAVSEALARADLIIAADSGANTAVDFGHQPAAVIGDLDSISPKIKEQLQAAGCRFEVSPAEKDETDTELAIDYAMRRGATAITILGGIEGGDRIDHVLANVFLLTHSPAPTVLASGSTVIWIAHGPAGVPVHGAAGDTLSLIPLTTSVAGITTTGLKYALTNSTLQFGKPRGISNVLTSPAAQVTFARGQLLFIHTHHILA